MSPEFLLFRVSMQGCNYSFRGFCCFSVVFGVNSLGRIVLYTVGGWGGESNREIVSFRVVRACVRARGADSEVGFGRKERYRFSLFPFGIAAFSLFPVEESVS